MKDLKKIIQLIKKQLRGNYIYLDGTRTILRTFQYNDLHKLMKWYNDEELNRLASGETGKANPRELYYNFSNRFGSDPINLIICNREKIPIGTIQLYDIDKKNQNCSLGIRIGERDCWGKGYATDAIGSLLSYAFQELHMNRVSLKVYEFNMRAYGCYIKCGFKHDGTNRKSAKIEDVYYDENMMSILRDEFLNPNTVL